MRTHDGWAAVGPGGKILPATFAASRAAVREFVRGKHNQKRIIRVNLIAADAPRRQR